MEPIHLAGTVIIKDGRLLLLWKIEAMHYEFPGGKVEEGEALESAAIRETEEEIGCTPLVIKYIGHNDFEKDGKDYQVHMFHSKLDGSASPTVKEPENFEEIFWMPIKDHKRFKLASNVREFCEDYMKTKKRDTNASGII